MMSISTIGVYFELIRVPCSLSHADDPVEDDYYRMSLEVHEVYEVHGVHVIRGTFRSFVF